MDRQVNRTEQRAQKQTHAHTANCSVTKEQKQCNGAKTVFSRNSAEKKKQNSAETRQTHTRKKNDTDLISLTFTKITDLNVKPESVNKTQKDIYITLGMARTF